MRFSLFPDFGALNSKPVFEAFARSIQRKNWKVAYHDESADVAVIWSVLFDGRMRLNQPIWERFKKTKRPVIVLEVGALDRGRLWKVGLNGINGSADFGLTNNDDRRRKKLNINFYPWKTQENIIICGQHPRSQQWEGMPPMEIWLKNTIQEIRQYTERKIIIRPHPRAAHVPRENFKNVEIKSPRHLASTYDSFDFDQALHNAWCVVNWNSNPATIAALKGTPVFVGPSSLASTVGNLTLKDIEKPSMPDREQWVNDLAYTEWTVEEIDAGEPLERVSQKLTFTS